MAAVWVTAATLGLKPRSQTGCSAAGELLERLQRDTGVSDFYVVCNGRVVDGDEPLQDGAVYHLEPRLRGGKGGFGSMLRALGAQIEKTTNREACRDLSGRRLRDVNHEKEMAEWLKKQSEREAEKEQRRLERLQKKLAEPKHHFSDSKYTQQCHELSERLEDSVLKGLQASSSSAVRPEATKRPSEERDGPESKRSKGFGWTGLDLDSDEESTDSEEAEPVSRGAESEDSGQSSSSPAPSEDQSTRTKPSPESSSRPGPSQSRPDRDQREAQTRTEASCGPDQDQGEGSSCGLEENQGESSPEAQSKPESSSSPDQNQTPEQQPLDSASPACPPQRPPDSASPACPPQRPLDLDSASCAQDLEALGLDVLKEELTKRGLKCGGTLSERAARLFSVRGKRPEDIDPALLAKNGKKKK